MQSAEISTLPLAATRTATVRALSLALWSMPVLAAGAYLALSPVRADVAREAASSIFRPAPDLASEAYRSTVSAPDTVRAKPLPDAKITARIAAAPERPVLAPTSEQILSATAMRRMSFANVTVVDAAHLSTGGSILALADLPPIAPESTCRRIDGLQEACAKRAGDRLSVLIQNRAVACDVTEMTPGLLAGRNCTADRIDIAADLRRLGLSGNGKR